MREITSTELATRPGESLDLVQHEAIVVTTRGRPKAVLVSHAQAVKVGIVPPSQGDLSPWPPPDHVGKVEISFGDGWEIATKGVPGKWGWYRGNQPVWRHVSKDYNEVEDG